MRRFRHEFQFNVPITRVAEFHSSTHALNLLTLPPMFVKFNQIEPLGEGSRSDFTLWLGPIPIHWVVVHSEVNPVEGFTDTRVEGRFQTWVHKHKFQSLSTEKTRIIDQIIGQPSGQFLRGTISRFMWLTLPLLFWYRARQTCRLVGDS